MCCLHPKMSSQTMSILKLNYFPSSKGLPKHYIVSQNNIKHSKMAVTLKLPLCKCFDIPCSQTHFMHSNLSFNVPHWIQLSSFGGFFWGGEALENWRSREYWPKFFISGRNSYNGALISKHKYSPNNTTSVQGL